MGDFISNVGDLVSSKIYSNPSFGVIKYHSLMIGNRALSYLRLEGGNCSRSIEYPWVLDNLKLSKGKRVLDVGCCRSFFSHVLIARGYDVYGLDVNPYPGKHPNLKFYQCDVRNTPFDDEYFHTIIAISTIEHIGIGYYGDPKYKDGDILTMKELKRILKKDGQILITLPYCKQYMQTGAERIYDEKRIKSLIEGLLLDKKDYYVYHGLGRWSKVSYEEAVKSRSSLPCSKIRTTVCLALRKINEGI